MHTMKENYQQNKHMYISLYYFGDLDNKSDIGNLLFNNRLTEKGRGEMLRFMLKNRLNSFEKKLDKVLRKRYVVGIENVLVDVDMSYKFPCIAKIDNLEKMLYGHEFKYKDYSLIFHV